MAEKERRMCFSRAFLQTRAKIERSSSLHNLLFNNDETLIRKNFLISDCNSLFILFTNGIFAKGL
ncbi:hypothetical protein J4228_01685 [Candidatus Woesearchaeota archaeon]|nr:hypothetical protein [Candidatus Woesearchaeota archaeon]